MSTVLPRPSISLEDGLSRVEKILAEQAVCEEPLLERMSRTVLFAGGKRLRPRIAILSYGAAGGVGKDFDTLLDAAAAVELIHTASLVHDDIIDASPLRRGLPTLHTSHGLGHAIVAGDFLFARGFALASKMDPVLVRITAEACTRLAEGEVLEQRLAGNLGIEVDAYLDVIARKTAHPIRACARVGAHVAGAASSVVEEMGRFGLELGLAFQIADDLLDLSGKPEETGKPVGLDGKAGVFTLPALLALGPTERGAYLRDPERLRRTLVESGAVDKAREVARAYAEKAVMRLDILPDSPHRSALSRLAESVVDRSA